MDPRRGVRLGVSYADHPRDKVDDPDFYSLDYNLLTYLPIGSVNTLTLTLNYYQSDAYMRSPHHQGLITNTNSQVKHR